ncbi:ABC transporter [Streptomyces sp. NPDC051315]|uniref:ABC transporter n=1 Tax=Streptomyces sp. NPDC051315 TaxID=3365650 RepID=UPI00378F161E
MRGVEERGSGPAGPRDGGRQDPGAPGRPGTRASLSPALLRALVPALWQALPWRVPAAAGGWGLVLLGAVRWAGWTPGEGEAAVLLRCVALSGALGLAFLFDDPARHTTATTPLGRPLRAGLRLALVAPLVALWWTAALLLVPGPNHPPLGPATLEAAAMAAAALALASAAVRFTDAAAVGKATAIRLAATAAVVVLVPERWGLSAAPGETWWEATQVRWAVVLGVTAAATALCTPEPLRRRSIRLGPSGAA